jgi:hypothetical protein
MTAMLQVKYLSDFMYVHIFQRHYKRSFDRSTDWVSILYILNKSDKPQSNILLSVCYCWLTHSILYAMYRQGYDQLPYEVPQLEIQWFISYHYKTQS